MRPPDLPPLLDNAARPFEREIDDL